MTTPRRVVVMGVSGSGKTTLAAALARGRGVAFVDADDLHPPSNVARMAAGQPLDDAHRWPWLAAVRQAMRHERAVVVACSALRRTYRNALRSADDVGFVHLAIDRDEAARRLAHRAGHFAGVALLDSQFETLEPPGFDERDIATLSAADPVAELVEQAERALSMLVPGSYGSPLLAEGGPTSAITDAELEQLTRTLATEQILAAGARRILLVPPDHTRLASRAGDIAGALVEALTRRGCEVCVLPALGTHAALDPAQAERLFGARVPFDSIRRHEWRSGNALVGSIGVDEMAAVSDGRVRKALAIELDETLLGSWDLVVSIGQVVPHEVIGMANYSKNLVIGLGGASTINASHFLGAVCGMESIMGRAHGPVRDVVDAAFDRFVAPVVPVLFVLTVVEDGPSGVVLRGVFAGRGPSGESGGAAYRAAAALAARCNISSVAKAFMRVSCWLDPSEFRTTWLANKAVYRTRMALGDGAELIVLAPGVAAFGEDPAIDALIRRHGYRGTSATLEAQRHDPELAANLGAAAHLMHGSSEGRFRIVYCTDPSSGGLSRREVEGVGYEWRPLDEELARLRVSHTSRSGDALDRDGAPFHHLANPALGLWATAERLTSRSREPAKVTGDARTDSNPRGPYRTG